MNAPAIPSAVVRMNIGQTIGWYRLDQGAGFIGATLGAIIVLFIWKQTRGPSHRSRSGRAHRVDRAAGGPSAVALSGRARGGRTGLQRLSEFILVFRAKRANSRQTLKEAEMGLADILNGMMHGPRGQRQPSSPGGGGGGMSPIMMALLGLLAYKALKGRGGQAASPSGPGSPGGAG
jgi:Transglycosylase associated protein